MGGPKNKKRFHLIKQFMVMFKDPHLVAEKATLSMLLEVSANPKSGNVDRMHDFEDMRYEHFLISSISSYRTFLKAAEIGSSGKMEIGKLIYEAAEGSKVATGVDTNIHLGTFLLLIPLVVSWRGAGSSTELAQKSVEMLKNTDYLDSIYVFKAFELADARVLDINDTKGHQNDIGFTQGSERDTTPKKNPKLNESLNLDLKSEKTVLKLEERNINLYEWMLKAPQENLISRELTEGYKISLDGMRLLSYYFKSKGGINSAIVYTYHHLLSIHPDPLIISKFGKEVAEQVVEKAKEALKTGEFGVLDEGFINRGINPGTIADLTASSIFLSLAEGLRF